MNWQIVIVSLFILAAAAYVGAQVLRKVKAFSPKNPGCGSSCGCDVKAKN